MRATAEANLVRLFAALDELLFVITPDGRLEHANRAACSRLGYTAEELAAREFASLVTPEQRGAANRLLSSRQGDAPLTLLGRGGNPVPLEIRLLPGTWKKVAVLFAVAADLPELQPSEGKFARAFEGAATMVAIWRAEDGRCVEVNQTFCRTLGLNRDEVVGRTPGELGLGGKHQDWLAASTRIQRDGLIAGDEVTARTRDGRVIHGLLSASPIVIGGVLHLLTCVADITARKRAEAALAQSERQFRLIAESSTGIISLHNPNGTLRYVSPAVTAVFGYLAAEMAQCNLREGVYPEDVPVLRRAWRTLSVGGGPVCLGPFRFRRKDGTWAWIESTAACVTMSDGTVCVQATSHDVTGRMHVELVQEARLRLQTAASRPVDDFLRDALAEAGALTGSSSASCHTAGPGERIVMLHTWQAGGGDPGHGGPFAPFAPFRDPASGEARLDCLRRRGPVICNRTEEPAAGTVPGQPVQSVRELVAPVFRDSRIVALMGVAGKDADYSAWDAEAVSQLACLAWDIAERKWAQAALEASARNHRQLLEDLPEAIVVHDGRTILFANAAAARMACAAGPEELTGMPVLSFAAADGWTEVAQLNSFPRHVETRYRRLDGSESDMEVSAAPTQYEGRPAIHMVLRDTADRKRLEREFLQAQKLEAVGRLAGGIAHDFNNLLTVINGYTSLLLKRTVPGAPSREELMEIEAAGVRAAVLVQQLLAFSRKQVLRREPLDLAGVVSNIGSMLGRLVGEDIEIAIRPAPPLPAVLADRNQIEQVVMNLVVNARDAIERHGEIAIAVDRDLEETECGLCHRPVPPGTMVRLTVRDNGSGMDEHARAHLFEPFFTTKPAGRGTGLGMATVQAVVEQSGGHIRVETAPGRGTAIHIYLPAVEDVPAGVPALPPPETLTGQGNILLVEDEGDVRRFAGTLLRGFGYEVLEAASGDEALRLCEVERFDLLLTDVVMPRMSGRELADAVTARQPHVKVLFMSGHSAERLAGYGWAGADSGYLEKPFDPPTLAVKVKKVLQEGTPRIHILVVDDEDAVRRFLRYVLERAGYSVMEAADGELAVRMLETQPADLVITDLVMPGQEGIETIRILRQKYPQVRILALSGARDGAYLNLARPLGADASLAKPVSAAVLLETVTNLLAIER